MTVVYSKTFPGMIHICSRCGCLFSYTYGDIYGNLIYCPVCKNADTTDIIKDYDGISTDVN